MRNKKKAVTAITILQDNLDLNFQTALEKEEIKRKILKSQGRMQKALSRAIKTGWEEMSEKERKMTIELGSLTQELERKLQELFKKEKN